MYVTRELHRYLTDVQIHRFRYVFSPTHSIHLTAPATVGLYVGLDHRVWYDLIFRMAVAVSLDFNSEGSHIHAMGVFTAGMLYVYAVCKAVCQAQMVRLHSRILGSSGRIRRTPRTKQRHAVKAREMRDSKALSHYHLVFIALSLSVLISTRLERRLLVLVADIQNKACLGGWIRISYQSAKVFQLFLEASSGNL